MGIPNMYVIPKIRVFGMILNVDIIVLALVAGIIPLLLGLIAAKSKPLGLMTLLAITLVYIVMWHKEAARMFSQPQPFDFSQFGYVLSVQIPGFVIGFFMPSLLKKVRARA